MFLTEFNHHPDDDRGSTLIPVLGIFAVSSIIVLAVTSATIGALALTGETRAGVESQAAVDAGLDWVRAEFSKNLATCATTIHAGDDNDPSTPHFQADIYTTSATDPAAAAWIAGCPSGNQTLLRAVVTGYADGAENVDGLGRESYGEIVLRTQLSGGTVTNEESGAAIYTYSGGITNASQVRVTPAGTADVRVISGDFICTSSGLYDGNIIVENGNAQLTNPCTVNGSVWAAGSVIVDGGGTITGDVIASGTPTFGGKMGAGTAMELQGSGAVGGSVWANGHLFLNGSLTIGGDVNATGDVYFGGSVHVKGKMTVGFLKQTSGAVRVDKDLVSANYSAHSSKKDVVSAVDPSIRIGGNMRLGAGLDTWAPPCNDQWTEEGNRCGLDNSAISGTLTIHTPGLVTPTAYPKPDLAEWVDVPYRVSDWTSSGYREYIYNGPTGECKIQSSMSNEALIAMWNDMKTTTIPTVYDARRCTPFFFNGSELTTKADITIITTQFEANAAKVLSNTTAKRNFNIIVPDTTPDRAPNSNCVGGEVKFTSGLTLGAGLRGIIYTPGKIIFTNPLTWRGQLYGCGIEFHSGVVLQYERVGIPGVNLDTGLTSSVTTGPTNASEAPFDEVVSTRMRSNAGP